VCLNYFITFTKIYWILPRHSNVTIKNLSWPHFSWATLYKCWQHFADVFLFCGIHLVCRYFCISGPHFCRQWLYIGCLCYLCFVTTACFTAFQPVAVGRGAGGICPRVPTEGDAKRGCSNFFATRNIQKKIWAVLRQGWVWNDKSCA